MFGTIRKHQGWLWWCIITVIIISFVIFFTPTVTQQGPGGRSEGAGSIGGKKISQEELYEAQSDVLLNYFLRTGTWPDQDDNARQRGFNLARETYMRVFLNRKLQDMDIVISEEAVTASARRQLGGASYEQLVGMLNQRKLGNKDYERFLRHELALEQLMVVGGLSGELIPPQAAEDIFRREHQERSTEAAFFLGSNFVSSVNVTPQALGQFYTNQMPRYRLPERMEVSYVKFNLTNFLGEAATEMNARTNLAQLIQMNYDKLGTNLYRDAKSPEEAKERIKNDMQRQLAFEKARQKSSEFANELFAKEPLKVEDLATLATTKGLSVMVSSPFSRNEVPPEIKVSEDFSEVAFGLNPDEPFTTPVAGEDGFYLVAFKRRIPSEQQPFEKVRAQVETDYKRSQSVLLARQAGTNFAAKATAGVAAGKTLSAIATEAKVNAMKLPPISMSTRTLPQVEEKANLNQLKQVAFETPLGKVSDFVSSTEGGFVLHAIAALPLDDAKVKAELPEFLNYMRQTRRGDAFQEWFRRQVEQDPGFAKYFQEMMQQQQPEMQGMPVGP